MTTPNEPERAWESRPEQAVVSEQAEHIVSSLQRAGYQLVVLVLARSSGDKDARGLASCPGATIVAADTSVVAIFPQHAAILRSIAADLDEAFRQSGAEAAEFVETVEQDAGGKPFPKHGRPS